MLDLLPPELRFHIYDFIDGSLFNLALTSRLLASEVSVYLEHRLTSCLRRISRGEKLEFAERELLHRFRRSDRYDELVLGTFEGCFFTLPIEFGLKVHQVSTLPPLELGLLRYRFPGREVYNTSDLEEIEPYLDRSLDVGVDSNEVHELNVFTHIDRVRSDLPYRNIVILNGDKIGIRFLNRCTSLRSLILPSGVTSIDYGFLDECTSLTTLTLPAGLTSFGCYFLNRCTSLTSLTIPAGVTSIDHNFLWRCSSLTTITLPTRLTSIDHNFLNQCTSLRSLILPTGVTSIGACFLNVCISLTRLSLPAELTSIGAWFLVACKSLTSLNFSARPKLVGCYFLEECTSLTSLNTPDGPIPKEEFIAKYRCK